jgi:Uncharacterized conserved protein
MKKILTGILLVAAIFSLAACGKNTATPKTETNVPDESILSENMESEEKQEYSEGQRTLIVYYSYSGVTESVAQKLRDKTSGDLFELRPVKPYPDDVYETSDRAEEERQSGNLPELEGELPDITDYDTILVGGPVWSETLAPPVMSYLLQTDFAGKTVAPFWTYNNNEGGYEDDMRDQIQNGEVSECMGLSYVSQYSEEELEQVLDEWLRKIGLLNETSGGEMETSILIKMGEIEITAVLNGSEAAKEFQSMLPVTVSMTRMGEHEYYGALERPLTHTDNLQTGYTVGDLAFWTPGDLFALYFDEPDEAPEGLMILGKITTDLSVFENLGSSEEVQILLAE